MARRLGVSPGPPADEYGPPMTTCSTAALPSRISFTATANTLWRGCSTPSGSVNRRTNETPTTRGPAGASKRTRMSASAKSMYSSHSGSPNRLPP